MYKTTLKELRNMVSAGIAVELTYNNAESVGVNYTNLAYSVGANGVNGLLLKNRDTGILYAIIGRCQTLFIFY